MSESQLLTDKLIGKLYAYMKDKCCNKQPGEKQALTDVKRFVTEEEFRTLMIDICDCESVVEKEDGSEEEEEEDGDYEEEDEEESEEEQEESEEEAEAEETDDE